MPTVISVLELRHAGYGLREHVYLDLRTLLLQAQDMNVGFEDDQALALLCLEAIVITGGLGFCQRCAYIGTIRGVIDPCFQQARQREKSIVGLQSVALGHPPPTCSMNSAYPYKVFM